jgi:ribonuclease HII
MLKRYHTINKLEVGVDEVARGCLVGRVYAAAVIWNPKLEFFEIKIPDIKDSKKLNKKKRKELRTFIEKYAIEYSIGWVDEKEIDEINIRNATYKAMHIALDKLKNKPDLILVDGNYFPKYKDIDFECIIKGDNQYLSIAAASILAKTYRDEYIDELIEQNPELEKYNWSKNSGYSTKDHINSIKKYGITDYHRKTFGICKTY